MEIEYSKVIQTGILASQENLGLLDIFLDANKLKEEIYISSYQYVTDPRQKWELKYDLIEISFDEHCDSATQLSYMAIVHNGIENMLVDYLLKCQRSPEGIYARYEKETNKLKTKLIREDEESKWLKGRHEHINQ